MIFIGDIKSKQRLITAFSNKLIILSCSCLKTDFMNTVLEQLDKHFGAQNIIEAGIETGVKSVVAFGQRHFTSNYMGNKLPQISFLLWNNISKY